MNLKNVKQWGAIFLAGGTVACGLSLAILAEDKPGKSAEAVRKPDPADLFDKLDTNKDGKLTGEEVGKEKAPLFERLLRLGDKNSDKTLTKDEFLGAMKQQDAPRGEAGPEGRGRRPGPDRESRPGREGGPRGEGERRPGRGPGPGAGGERGELFFILLDQNKDGRISVEEVPERAKPLVRNLLRRAEKKEGDSLNQDEFLKLMADGPGRFGPGRGRPDRPGMRDGDRPRAERGPRDGDRRPGPRGEEPRGERGPRDGEGPRRPQFGGPKFFRLLDTNNDRVLSKDELSKSAEKFDELDTNKDGKLDLRELLGPPPEGRPGPEGRRGPPDGRPGPEGRRGPPDGRPGPEGRRGPPDGRPGPEGRRGPPEGRPDPEGRREGEERGGGRPQDRDQLEEYLDL